MNCYLRERHLALVKANNALDLGAGISDFAPPEQMLKALHDAIDEGPASHIYAPTQAWPFPS